MFCKVHYEPEIALAEEGNRKNHSNDERPEFIKAELRRQMYERMAQGNALSEIEENAHRKLYR